MTPSRDPERMIRAFLDDGAEQLADPVYDVVRAEIEKKRQRVVIGPWRMPTVNKLMPLGLGVAAVVGVLLVGTRLAGPSAPGVGGAPSAEPSSTSSVGTPDGSLPEGQHHLFAEGVPMTVTIPAPGWYGLPGIGILTKNDNADPPDGAGMIVFAGLDNYYVYGNPCKWSTTTPATPATTVDELVAALAAQPTRNASAPVDVTVGGHAGKSITLHVPDDVVLSECDQGYFGSWGDGIESTPSRHHQGPGQIDKLWIVDVDGELAVIDAASFAGTPQAVTDELDAIVASMTFE